MPKLHYAAVCKHVFCNFPKTAYGGQVGFRFAPKLLKCEIFTCKLTHYLHCCVSTQLLQNDKLSDGHYVNFFIISVIKWA